MKLSGMAALLLGALTLAGCGARMIPPGAQAPPAASRPAPIQRPATQPTPGVVSIPATPLPPQAVPSPGDGSASAAGLGVAIGPEVSVLRLDPLRAARALGAFRASCPGLMRRTDTSGLTRSGDWTEACRAAAAWPDSSASSFFERHFTAVQVGDGRSFATGYYEPEIAGSRDRRAGYEVPIYGRPTDLIDADLGLFLPELSGKRIRGRINGTKLIPYDDRAAIDGGSLNGRAPVIAWAADSAEFFFLQVQGSGRLRLPDGNVMRIGFASANGQPYTGIGGLMKDRGLLQPGESTMQGIVAWLRRNPEEGRRIMQENRSFVFFTEITGRGPVGAMGYPVLAETTVAADPKYVPLGAPVWLSVDRAEASGIWVAQDTGGAIKGANRFDTFWGAGERAAQVAGGMAARGSALVLVPHVAAARLGPGPAR